MEITTVESFLHYLERIRGRTRRVIDCIPPEKLEWTYQAGKFTLGDMIRHLAAIERYMFAEATMNNPSCYPGHGRELADGWDDVLRYFDTLHAESVEIFSRLTPEDLSSKCRTPLGTSISVWKWLRAMIEHEIHHRGQIYLYLAMLGISGPPLYGLTEEEVLRRSQDGR